jgi:hypothetical protein
MVLSEFEGRFLDARIPELVESEIDVASYIESYQGAGDQNLL